MLPPLERSIIDRLRELYLAAIPRSPEKPVKSLEKLGLTSSPS